MELGEAKLAVVRVGAGRGFVVESSGGRLVITAAHCLPEVPPAMSFSLIEERTFSDLLGALEVPPTIAAECLFVDPVADIAVLGEPDSQSIPVEWEAYDNMATACSALPVSSSLGNESGLLLHLDGLFRPCILRASHLGFRIEVQPDIQAGMAGSPILNTRGEAVGVVVTNKGPHPKLIDHLPAWLARDLFGK